MFVKSIVGLIISIAIAEGTGALSSLFTGSTMADYKNLVQPELSPPGWVFPVVWTVLYLLMGIASYRVYNSDADSAAKKSALMFYALQLVFNFLWTIIFFRLQARGFAFLWILVLLLLIIITTVKFYSIDKTAGYLMIPYILWVCFASYLNFTIWQLNNTL